MSTDLPGPDVVPHAAEGDVHEGYVPDDTPPAGAAVAAEADLHDDYTPGEPGPDVVDTAPEPDVVEQRMVVEDAGEDERPVGPSEDA